MLNRHRRNHNPYKKYKCNFCEKASTIRSTSNDTSELILVNYRLNHLFLTPHHRQAKFGPFLTFNLGVKPYNCNQCEKSFTQRCSLESHMDKIHGVKHDFTYKQRREKIYVCEDCGHSTHDVR